MTNDEPREGPYGGQSNPWAVPGVPAGPPFGAAPTQPPQRGRSRVLKWIAGVIVVVLLASGAGFVIYDDVQPSSSAPAVAAQASSAPPAPSSAPHPSPSPQSSSTQSSPPQSSPPQLSPPQSSPSQSSPSSSGLPTAPAAGTAPGSGSGPLDQYLLAPTEVSANSMMFLIDGGRSITDQATLDWCNFTYTSEKLRNARVQVEYTGNDSLPVGNEFVRYQSGGTNRAWAEIQRAAATCPATSTTDGYVNDLVQRAPSDNQLVARQLILSYRVTDPTGQLSLQWQAVVYQFDGNYFSGIYVYGQSRALALTQAEALAAKSARHLAEASRGKPGTGGGPIQSVTSSPPTTGVQD